MRKSQFVAIMILGAAILLIPFAATTIGQQQETEKIQDVTPRLGYLPPWFKDLDTDGDGKISLDEWREGGKDIDAFRKFDTNGDGFISAEEVLRHFRKPLPKGLPPWFKELDTDGDGQITLHQWLEGGKDRAEFRKYDLNGDGFVTAEEVISYMKKRVELKLTNAQGVYQGIIEESEDELYRGKKCFKIITVKLEQDKTYQFDHMSNAFDAYLYLEDPEGVLLAENDDGPEGVHSRIVFRAGKTGNYRVIATSLGHSRPGPFLFVARVINRFGHTLPNGLPWWFNDLDRDGDGQISLHEWQEGGRELDDFHKYDLNGDGFITMEEVFSYLKKPFDLKLAHGQGNYNGAMEESPDDHYRGKKSFKVFSLKLEEGNTYQFDQISAAFQSCLHLEDAEGNVLAEAVSPSVGGNCRLVFRPEDSGTYRLIATSAAGVRTGAFSLDVHFGNMLAKGLPRWFKDLDKDGDGQVSLLEWRQGGRQLADFHIYDLNGDGFITGDEVITHMKKPFELKFANEQVNFNGTIEETPDDLYRGKKSYKTFAIKLEAGKTYQFDHTSAAFQAFLHLEDSQGNLLQENSSDDVGGHSRLVFRAEKSGTYHLIATSAGGFRTGDFSLSVHSGHLLAKGLPKWFTALDKKGDGQISLKTWREAGKDVREFQKYDTNGDGLITADEVLLTVKRAIDLTLNNGQANYNGVIEETTDLYRGKKSFKMFALKLEEGKTYQIDHISAAFHAYLYLENSEGAVLQEHGAPNVGDNARLLIHIEQSGTYRLIATSSAGVRTGDFSLSVRYGSLEPVVLPSWFTGLDKDADGQVSLQEWRDGGKDIDDFRKYDLNGDGFITGEEIVRAMKKTIGRILPKGLPKWFHTLDKDADGQISLHKWLASGRELEDFRKYDLNGDDFITADEVLRTLKRSLDLTLNDGQAKYNGTIEESADELYRGKKSFKVFSIKLEEGKTYQFDHISAAYQAFLSLDDEAGNVLVESASPDIGGNCRLVFRAEKPGTYRLIATSAGGYKTGDFVLSVRYGHVLAKHLPPWFHSLDKNGDGQISIDEWRDGGKEAAEFRKYDLNGDGLITAEEVVRYLKKPLPQGLPPWFKELDPDGEGHINFQQWHDSGRELGEFRKYDLNSDGMITADEVIRYLKKALPKGLPSWFHELDLDGDGQISLDEWREGGKELHEFRKYDLNRDGFITEDELLRALNK